MSSEDFNNEMPRLDLDKIRESLPEDKSSRDLSISDLDSFEHTHNIGELFVNPDPKNVPLGAPHHRQQMSYLRYLYDEYVPTKLKEIMGWKVEDRNGF